MKKIIALLLALVMVLALCACGAKEEAPAEAPAAEAPAAAPAAEAPAAAPAATGDFESYKTYVAILATAGAPTEEEQASMEGLIMACADYEELSAISQMSVLLGGPILTYDAWVEAGCPEADPSTMQQGDPNAAASGEASGEPSAEPAA